jgi:hypothetical protein
VHTLSVRAVAQSPAFSKPQRKPTWRDVFLKRMDDLRPWACLVAQVERHGPVTMSSGRPSFPVERLLRMRPSSSLAE